MMELCNPTACTGCEACYNKCPRNCITMAESFEGFLYPEINSEKCVECGLCRNVCPILHESPKGEIPETYAAWSLNDSVRTSSSSGGMFYTLAEYVISLGGVVFGAVFDEEMNVRHTYSETLAGVLPMKGSKYVQSIIGDSYRQVQQFLKQGRYVLFTGTPCQVDALRSFLGKSHARLFLVDIICHGVPSNKLFRYYLNQLSKKLGQKNIRSFQFRDLKGWSITPSIFYARRRRIVGEYNVYIRLFSKALIQRNSCYQCKYTSDRRVGDITIADFLGLGEVLPFEEDMAKGVSLILVNTSQGKGLLKGIEKQIALFARSLDEAMIRNSHLKQSSKRPDARDDIYFYLFLHDLKHIDYKYIHRTIKSRLKNEIKCMGLWLKSIFYIKG